MANFIKRMIKMSHQEGKNEKLNKIIELVDESEISSIKNVVSTIIQYINDPKTTTKNLKEIIEVDPPLAARVLRLANSAYYSSRNKVSEIMQAIIWVGFEAIKELALNQKVSEIFNKNESIEGYSRNSLWKHCLAVALLGKMIYRREFGERGENIYAAGLMHDIGIIVEDQFYQEKFTLVMKKSKNEKKNVAKAEYGVFGFDHTDVGGAIIDSWKIPQELCVAIGNHHNPDRVDQEFSRITSTLYIADSFCQEKGIGFGDSTFADNGVFNGCLRKLGLEYHALDLIVEEVEKEILKMEDEGFFS